MATHTPGPWMVGNHPGDNSGTDWREVLSTDGAFSPSYVCQALLADARLIAAAPDMLAALVAAYAAIDAINPRDQAVGALNRAGLAHDIVQSQRAIRAAIAKATGP